MTMSKIILSLNEKTIPRFYMFAKEHYPTGSQVVTDRI